jgi:phosphatidylserine decarboxylase
MISCNQLQVFSQYIIPQHGLSRFVGSIINSRQEKFKNYLIDFFIKRYNVDMRDAIEPNPHVYPDFNSFFTRKLRPETRPIIDGENTIACPADGLISEYGAINESMILQAKNHEYSIADILGGSKDDAAAFIDGQFATFYLAPKDYHRVHIPITGQLQKMIHVPGKLFSVNLLTADHVPNLFARNERVICIFSTKFGPMAVILVGAMIVASIHTAWAGAITPSGKKQITVWDYPENHTPIILQKGAELGHFQLGSTVIVLFGPQSTKWTETLQKNQSVKIGQPIGETI